MLRTRIGERREYRQTAKTVGQHVMEHQNQGTSITS
jgi:hypothetical protein